MAIKRITLSVPEELAAKIKHAAGDKPVSAWVTEKIEADLSDVELERQWIEFVNKLKPTAADEAWVQAALDRLGRRTQTHGDEQLAA